MDTMPIDGKDAYLLDTPSSVMGRSDSEFTSAAHKRRRVRDDVPWRLWLVAVVGFWERAAFWGLTAPWQNYMEHPLRDNAQQSPGALGLGQSTATRIYCAFYVFYYASPVAIAVLADGYLGRYATLLGSTVLYCLGCVVLTLSSSTGSLERGFGLPGLLLAMSLISLGGGGFRATFVPFIADQQPQRPPRLKELRNGELVITDYHLTLQYIYSLYYWVGNLGSLSWFATVYIELHIGFTAAYGLALGFMAVASVTLVGGSRYYVKAPRTHNPLPEAARVILCACRSGFSMARADPVYQLRRRHKVVSWSAALVKELTRGLQVCRVLLAFVMFYVCFDQMQNNLISQTSRMDTNGAPNDLIPVLNQVGCIFLGPLIQGVLYPLLHRCRVYLTPVTRITIGFALVALSMLHATVVQVLIYRSPPCFDQTGNCGPGRVNVWIQAPLYFLISAGEIFAYVTALEYTYSHAPSSMKVVVQAMALLVGSIGSACAMALTPAARDPYLVIFYGSLTGGMAGTTLLFWMVFRGDAGQQTAAANDASDCEAAIHPAHRAARRASSGAPVLKPIDAGSPIELPSRAVSRSSTIPPLPEKSARRPRQNDSRTAWEMGRYTQIDVLYELPSQRLHTESQGGSRQASQAGRNYVADGFRGERGL